MQISRLQKVLNDQSLWENLEVIITGSGAVIYTNRIEGFVRKLSYLDPRRHTMRGNCGSDFYFTHNDGEDSENPIPQPSLGTLKIVEEDNVLIYTDKISGYDIEIDIDQVQQIVYTKDKTDVDKKYFDKSYPGNPTYL